MFMPPTITAVVANEQIRDRIREADARRAACIAPRRPRLRSPWTQPRPKLEGAGYREGRQRVTARHAGRLLLGTAAALLAVVSSFVGPGASAHTAIIATQHSLNLDPTVLSGQLGSTVSACLSGRTITLYRAGTAGATAVFNTSTGSTGAWTHNATGLPGGEYYALAAAKSVRSSGHKHTCASAKSNAVVVPIDADGDGYPAPGDCRDADPAINPGVPEVLNGVDDDCDGTVDEGLEPAPTCWTPSSDPVTAETTWSQVGATRPCTWELHTWTVLPGAVYLVSPEWLIEYRPALGESAAFAYAAQDWAYFATHPNSIYSGDQQLPHTGTPTG